MASISTSDFYDGAARRALPRAFRISGFFLSFLSLVILPLLLCGWYLWNRAVDQYVSDVGFAVRSEEAPAPSDIFGGFQNFSASSAKDSDILFEFIQSQEMVQILDQKLDLRDIFSRDYAQDPLFSLHPGASIEDLLAHWKRVASVNYTPNTGLLELRIHASDPDTAQMIAESVFEQSSLMINRLSAIAREDAMHYSRLELESAVSQLKTAREAVTKFRSRTQIVDPDADIQVQMGLLNSLQQQLGEELIAYDLLVETTRADDPRIAPANQRIAAIRKRIAQERRKFGIGGNLEGTLGEGEDYATLITEYERLKVDQQFSEQKYTGALTNYDLAKADAQRKSRYLAAYVQPTLAETAIHPRRLMILALAGLILTIFWAIISLIYVSLRDRR